MTGTMLMETHEKAGTLRKDRQGPASAKDSERVQELPEAPAHLWATGKRVWQQQGEAMIEAGVLTNRDLLALEHLATLFQQMIAWSRTLESLLSETGALPAGNEDVKEANTQLQRLNAPINKACELLGIGALARTVRSTKATKAKTGGSVPQRSKGVPGRSRG